MNKPSTGPRGAAEALAGLDEATRERIMAEIQAKDPKLADAIKNQMFLFQDLLKYPTQELQTVLMTMDRSLLAIALRKSDDEVKNHLMHALTSRMRNEMEELIATVGPQKQSDIESAQRKIVELFIVQRSKKKS